LIIEVIIYFYYQMNTNKTYLYLPIIFILLLCIYYYSQYGNNLMGINQSYQKIRDNIQMKINGGEKKDDVQLEIMNNEDNRIFLTDDIKGVFNENGPEYLKENSTQFDWKKLLKNLDDINKGKMIKLKGETNYQFYTQSTTRDRLRMDLDQITQQLITILNSNTYDFAKTNYGDVEVWTDKHNNEEIKYELFLWDKKNFFEIKFLVHVIKFVHKKQCAMYGVKKSPYLFPTYFMGYNVEDQIIPPPGEVIPTMNSSNYPEGICDNAPEPIKYLYLNRVEIWNSTLVVNYAKDMTPDMMMPVSAADKPNTIGGVSDLKLYYSNVKGDHNPLYQKAKLYNQTFQLPDEPAYKKNYPCLNPPLDWNEEGVYYYPKGTGALPQKVDPRFCVGTAWSSMKLPVEPNFWVNNYNSFNCGENEWLFDNSKSLPGVFVGGGKR